MYLEFLQALATYIEALNTASAKIDEKVGITPYVDHVPVVLDGQLCGFLVDEVGGAYQYTPATAVQQTWWSCRPWARS